MPEGNDMSKLLIRSIFTIILLMGLSACGGGGGLSGGDDTGGDDTGGDTGETEAPIIKMGVYTGHTFTEGALDIEDNTISAISSTTVTVNFVYEDNTAITDGIDRVTFSSTCAETDPATATITSPVTISSGEATATYTPTGCTGTDTITAQASYDGETLTATGTITVSPIRIGLLAGSSFTSGTLKISDSTISAISSSTVTAYLVDQDNQPITGGISHVAFTSDCVEAETATIATPATVSTGIASTTYTPAGCIGTDTITAEATYFGQTITATVDVVVSPIRIGLLAGSSFTPGSLKIEDSTISAIGTTTVTAYLVDQDDQPITSGIGYITFSSDCVEAETASITSLAIVSSGSASATYTAEGCAGADTVSAEATYYGQTITATGTITVSTVSIGSFVNSTFAEGTLKIAVSSISSGGTTSITTNLVNENDQAIADGIINQVTFSSDCTSEGIASITSPSTVSSGIATTTYTASGCEGDDDITATASINGNELTAVGTISIAPQTAGSISFIPPSTPINLSIQGAGGTETADITFQVLSADGDPIEGETVNFTANTYLGGLSLSPTSIDSDPDGYVTTTVSSGTLPTSVVAIATLDSNSSIATVSNNLSISSGLPTQKGFGIVLSEYNIEIDSHTGVTIDVTAYASGLFASSTIDGIEVSFIAEGGQLNPASCTIIDGECSVEWKSTTDIPADKRITILAYTEGQETFTDLNSTGLFDDLGEFDAGNDDMPEVWLDKNENGTYDAATEPFFDSGVLNGVYDSADGVFNGFQCNHSSCLAAIKSIHVRDSKTLVSSPSRATISVTDISPLTTVVNGETCILLNAAEPTSTVTFTVIGINGQQMPGNTTAAVSTINQGTATLISGETPWPTNNTSIDPVEFTASIERDEEIGSGTFKITVTSGNFSEVTEENVCIVEE